MSTQLNLRDAAKELLALKATSESSAGLGVELTFRARRIVALRESADLEESTLADITRCLDNHPDGYEGPCECKTCMSYATDDHDA